MIDSFSRAIWISVMGHGIVVMILFLRAVIMPSTPMLIQDAIRVDVVGLPEKAAELPKEPAPPAPAPEQKVKEKPVAVKEPEPKPEAPKIPDPKSKKDLSKSQKEALKKLNAKAALDKIKNDLKNEKEKSAAKPAAPVVKGNQKADGNSLTGLTRLDFNRYAEEVKAKVRGNNNIPQWLADGDYKATIIALIDQNGYVVRKTILKSSGNEVFDAKAIEALEASSPFSPPPPDIQASLSTGGITFNFP